LYQRLDFWRNNGDLVLLWRIRESDMGFRIEIKGLGRKYDGPTGLKNVFSPFEDKDLEKLWEQGKPSIWANIGHGAWNGLVFAAKQSVKVFPGAGYGVEGARVAVDVVFANSLQKAIKEKCTCNLCADVVKKGMPRQVDPNILYEVGLGAVRGAPLVGQIFEGFEALAQIVSNVSDDERLKNIRYASVKLWLGAKSGCVQAQAIAAALDGDWEKMLAEFSGIHEFSLKMVG